jgi:outer membrane protein assembly factor BamB
MRAQRQIFFWITATISSHVVLGASWTMYLWDPSRSSFNPAESLIDTSNVGTLAPLGSFRADGGFAAAPTVVDGVAYVGDWTGRFYAIRASGGRTLWSLFVMAFDAATGEPLWNDGGRGQLYSQPVVVDGLVYSTYVSGEMVVWGLQNGSPQPQRPRPVAPHR